MNFLTINETNDFKGAIGVRDAICLFRGRTLSETVQTQKVRRKTLEQ